jgi:hypothetical protein
MFLLIEQYISLAFTEYETPKRCSLRQERVRHIFRFMKYFSTNSSFVCAIDRKVIKLSVVGHFRDVSDILNTVYFVLS